MGIGSGSDDAMRPRQEFARRFVEGIEKLVGNTPGDHRKKTGILATRMLEAARSMGATAPASGLLACGRPLRPQ
ncbi:hypothetical protein BHM03_00059028, partial [Ensete ventricosum]